MMRHGIRRCANLVRVFCLSSAATVLHSRPTPRTARTKLPLASTRLHLQHGDRFYSSEATAERDRGAEHSKSAQVTNFNELSSLGVHTNLIRAITTGIGYREMTPVQSKTINPALKGTDIVAQAKTGTGKTIAFLLPMLQRMIDEDPTLASRQAMRAARSDDIRGIVLSPTRELAEQIAVEAKKLVAHTGLVVQCAVGGTRKDQMLYQTRRQGCHILVATPGRLYDLLSDPNSGIDAPNLAALVLDEADRMLDVGFERELNDIIRALPDPKEKVRQTMLVSATIPDDVIRLARTMVRPHDFEFVQTIAEHESLTHENVPQNFIQVRSWSNIFPCLFEFFDKNDVHAQENRRARPFKAIVYFNTTAMTELAGELGYQRRQRGMRLPTFSIQSRLSQMQRTKAADLFRNARTAILFSSDVTARGMDFPDVTHVIQVDAPRDRESYIHRLGRTGRQNKEGEGLLLIPSTSLNLAQRMLSGLPLRQDSLSSAEVNIATEELPKYHVEAKELTTRCDRRILTAAYTSLFGGQKYGRDVLANDLNLWATKGWGWPQPPAVTSSWVRNQGLTGLGLNIREDSGGRDRFGGGDRSNDLQGGQSSDPFASMGSQIRRDDPSGPRRNRRFGGSRSFDSNRSSSGRYY